MNGNNTNNIYIHTLYIYIILNIIFEDNNNYIITSVGT